MFVILFNSKIWKLSAIAFLTVFFTCRYFNLCRNTINLSQSSFRNKEEIQKQEFCNVTSIQIHSKFHYTVISRSNNNSSSGVKNNPISELINSRLGVKINFFQE